MIGIERYQGDEGSLDDPAFPLRYNHVSGAFTICYNEEDLIKARELELEMEKQGFLMALVFCAVVAGLGILGVHAYRFITAFF